LIEVIADVRTSVVVRHLQRDKETRRNNLRKMAEENKRMIQEKERIMVSAPLTWYGIFKWWPMISDSSCSGVHVCVSGGGEGAGGQMELGLPRGGVYKSSENE
jgi:hypothetical protein